VLSLVIVNGKTPIVLLTDTSSLRVHEIDFAPLSVHVLLNEHEGLLLLKPLLHNTASSAAHSNDTFFCAIAVLLNNISVPVFTTFGETRTEAVPLHGPLTETFSVLLSLTTNWQAALLHP